MTDKDTEEEARATLEKNKEKLRRLRREFDKAEDEAVEPDPGPVFLGPKTELEYRRMKRDMEQQEDDDE